MRQMQDRTINLGGRVDPTSKLYGGIGFLGNTTATTIAAQGAPTRITSTPAYTALFPSTGTILPSTYVNANWTLVGATTPVQVLKYSGPNAFLTAHFGVTVATAAANEVSVRLVKQPYDEDGNALTPVAITTQLVAAAVANLRFVGRWSFPVEVHPQDEFYLDIANITAVANIIVASSEIVFTQ